MNNGNVNNNNKNNKHSVLALSEFQGKQEAGVPVFYITDDSLRDAYRRCLKHKKSTTNTAIFRVNELANLKELLLDIQAGTYYPGTSIAFMTEGREVFAAEFRDRIVHTWCAMRIIPLLERQFVPTTWNCREGKGTLRAVQNLRSQIRAVSENYTRDAWVMIFDLSGFFMNINREQAADRLCRFIAERHEGKDKATLLWLTRTIITHAPERDCIRYGTPEEWAKLPERKSLFYRHGLPIGDLLSQLDGNFELDVVDQFITRRFASDRYVDDFALVSTDKQALLNTMPVIRELLQMTCGAHLNPCKFKICHWSQGFRYLGVIINKDKAYPSGKAVGKAYSKIYHFNRAKRNEQNAQDFANSLNSYFGIMKHYDCEEIKQKLVGLIEQDWFGYFTVIDNEKFAMRVPRRVRLRRELRAQRKEFNNLKYSIKCSL